MKRILAVLAISTVMPFSGIAQAQEFPSWPLTQTCMSGDSSCGRFEQFARGQISGTWTTLPPKVRASCVTQTESVEKSYRLLQSCLANAMQVLLKNQQRKADDGKVVHLTPKAKMKAPPPAPAPAPVAEPAPVEQPAAAAPAATPPVKPQ